MHIYLNTANWPGRCVILPERPGALDLGITGPGGTLRDLAGARREKRALTVPDEAAPHAHILKKFPAADRSTDQGNTAMVQAPGYGSLHAVAVWVVVVEQL
jgi:hypothetical protein